MSPTGNQLIQSPHVHERLRGAYGIKGSALAPELNPSVQPVCIVDDLSRENDIFSNDTRQCCGTVSLTAGDGATTFPVIGFFHDGTDVNNILVVVDRILLCVTASATIRFYFLTVDALIAVSAGRRSFTDRRLAPSTPALDMRTGGAAAAIANQDGDIRVNGNGMQQYEFPAILGRSSFGLSGGGVAFQPGAGTFLSMTAWWREMPARR